MAPTMTATTETATTAPEECPICYTEFSNVESMEEIPVCSHRFCKSCLARHCSIAIQEHKLPIPCPNHRCKERMGDDFVYKLLCSKNDDNDDNDDVLKSQDLSPGITVLSVLPQNDETSVPSDLISSSALWRKYNRIRLLKDETIRSSAIVCAKCNAVMKVSCREEYCRYTPSWEEDWIVPCPLCARPFCRLHGQAHAPDPIACHAYNNKHNNDKHVVDDLSRDYLTRSTKPCPHCGVAVSKTEGCDHIVCVACDGDFCWACGSAEHLTGDVVRYCHQCRQGYIDHRKMNRFRAILCLQAIISLPFSLLYLTTTLLLTIVTCGCCGELCRGTRASRQALLLVIFYPYIAFMSNMGLPYGCERCISREEDEEGKGKTKDVEEQKEEEE